MEKLKRVLKKIGKLIYKLKINKNNAIIMSLTVKNNKKIF